MGAGALVPSIPSPFGEREGPEPAAREGEGASDRGRPWPLLPAAAAAAQAGARAALQRGLRPKIPIPFIVITTSPFWFSISPRVTRVPRSGLLREGRASRTVKRAVSVSPGRTGTSQRTSSTP